jgi:hypothetical protein
MRVRAWLKKTGTSIRQLALLADVSYPTTHELVRNDEAKTKLTARKISAATGGAVSVMELLTPPRSRGSAVAGQRKRRRARAAERVAA